MKTVQKIIVFAVLLANSASLVSQTDKLLLAFTKSYACETKADYIGAISLMKEVYDKTSYEVNLRLGWLNYEAGYHKESMNYYKTAIGLMPFSIEAKLGYVYPANALGNMNEVIDQYKKILEIDPQNSTVNYRMGYLYYNKKEYQAAHKHFEKVVNLYPFGYDGLLMLAWTNFQLGKTREAKVLFQKVLLLSPSDTSALEGLSLIK